MKNKKRGNVKRRNIQHLKVANIYAIIKDLDNRSKLEGIVTLAFFG